MTYHTATLERERMPLPSDPIRRGPGDEGPRDPKVRRPNTKDLLERMKRVDPDQAKRYRQRSGQ